MAFLFKALSKMVEVPTSSPEESERVEDALIWACKAYDIDLADGDMAVDGDDGGSRLVGSSQDVISSVAALPAARAVVATSSLSRLYIRYCATETRTRRGVPPPVRRWAPIRRCASSPSRWGW